MKVKIRGIGPVLACGRGIDTLKASLQAGHCPGDYGVSLENLEDFVPPRLTRRLDHLTRMVLYAVHLAVKDAGIKPEEMRDSNTGIVWGTALGAQRSTFSFMDGMIDCGDALVSSFAFTNSVHSTAAAQAAFTLGIRGPVRTVTTFSYTVGAAVETALSWLGNDRVERVLLILGEESSPVLTYSIKKMGGGVLDPFSPNCSYAGGEGCVAFLLEKGGGGYCRFLFHDMCLTAREAIERAGVCDMLFCAAAGKADEFEAYELMWRRAPLVGAYSSLYGSLFTGMGVELAIAALSIRDKVVFKIPGVEDAESRDIKLPGGQNCEIKKTAVAAVCGTDRVTYTELTCLS